MAFSKLPTDVFPGYTATASAFTILLTDLEDHGLLTADIHATTGDSRKILYAIAGRIAEWLNELDDADKPVAFSGRAKSSFRPLETGEEQKNLISITFDTYLDWPAATVSDEPTA